MKGPYEYDQDGFEGWYEPKKKRYVIVNHSNGRTATFKKDLFEKKIALMAIKKSIKINSIIRSSEIGDIITEIARSTKRLQ